MALPVQFQKKGAAPAQQGRRPTPAATQQAPPKQPQLPAPTAGDLQAAMMDQVSARIRQAATSAQRPGVPNNGRR